MRGIEGEQVLVRIYLGESKTAHHKPLYRQIIELLRSEGLAGTTVLKGCVGFGHDRVVHTANIECLATDLPVVIEAVDSPEHVEQLLGKIDALMTGGLVMTERAHVVRVRRTTVACRPAGPVASLDPKRSNRRLVGAPPRSYGRRPPSGGDRIAREVLRPCHT